MGFKAPSEFLECMECLVLLLSSFDQHVKENSLWLSFLFFNFLILFQKFAFMDSKRIEMEFDRDLETSFKF